MGMYDQEELFGESFVIGDRFILMNLEYVGPINTRMGSAEKSRALIVSREHPTEKRWYSVLGVGLARMAKQCERSDFPHVAELIEVPTGKGDQHVKLFARVDVGPRDFLDGDDGPALAAPDVLVGGGGGESRNNDNGDDDIPF